MPSLQKTINFLWTARGSNNGVVVYRYERFPSCRLKFFLRYKKILGNDIDRFEIRYNIRVLLKGHYTNTTGFIEYNRKIWYNAFDN